MNDYLNNLSSNRYILKGPLDRIRDHPAGNVVLVFLLVLLQL